MQSQWVCLPSSQQIVSGMSAEPVPLRYGFDLDRDFFLDFSNRFQIYLAIAAAVTIHPAVLYFLLYKNKSMTRDIKIGYIWNTISFMINEWYLSIAFRPHFIFPYDAIYCDGPICRLGIPKPILITLFVFFITSEILPFEFLIFRMHQSFNRMHNRPQIRMRWQIALATGNLVVLLSIVVSWAIFAQDSDDAPIIMEEPEIQLLLKRGGTVFMFGRPGNAQYFRYAIISVGVASIVISPFAFTFMIQSMRLVKLVRRNSLVRHTDDMAKRIFTVLSSQVLNTSIVFMLPITILCLFTFIDTTPIPGVIFAPLRTSIFLLFCLNPTQSSLVFLLKNPMHRKRVQDFLKSIWDKIRNKFGISVSPAVSSQIINNEATFTTGWIA